MAGLNSSAEEQRKEGAYLANEEEAEKLKNVMWDETGHRLPNTVAISPQKLAEAAGFTIPDDRKFIAVTGGGMEGVGKEHFFSSEKLTTLLTLFKYEGEFQNALDMMQAIFNVGGKGHSCGIYSWDDDHINRLGMCAPVSRIMVRQPNNRGNSGSSTNGMPPTSSMGCGTWGGNIVSENITLKHYMNTTWVARPLPEDMPSSEKLTTLLTLFKYEGEFQNALDMMQAIFNVGGKGHSCGIYSWDDDHINRLGMCAPVSRIMVRQPNNRGNSGSSTNGMPPTSSMGCGTWGGNIVSENITLKHYMNTTWVARPLPEDMPSNEELFGEFNKPDMDVE